MANELVVQGLIAPDLLLARALLAINRQEVLEKLRYDIEGLAPLQLARFSGSVNRREDVHRAQQRVIRLINLGLERAAIPDIPVESEEILQRAIVILTRKPISLIYTAGEMMFEQNASQFQPIIERCQVQFDGIWYRLVDAEEFNAITATTDLDRMRGTLVEYQRALNACFQIERTLQLVPFFPVTASGLYHHHHWGSTSKGVYSTEYGLVSRFLLSLMIISLFREEEDLFVDREVNRLKGFFLERVREARDKGNMDNALRYAESLKHFHEFAQYDQERREWGGDRVEAQYNFLARVLHTTLEETRQFADMLYLDPETFVRSAERIRTGFEKYLLVVEGSLRLHIERRVLVELIVQALKKVSVMIRAEVKRFYSTIDDPEYSQVDIMRFWDERVYLSEDNEAFKRVRKEAVAERFAEAVDVQAVLKLPVPELVDATGSFELWGTEAQELFCKLLNPNMILAYDYGALQLARILYAISPATSSGWGEKVLEKVSPKVGTALEGTAWPTTILQKMGWEHTDPDRTADLWEYVSDEVRDLMLDLAYRMKVSTRSVDLFIARYPDARLLQVLLIRLVREGKVKATSTALWQNLRQQSAELPHVRSAIQEAFDFARK